MIKRILIGLAAAAVLIVAGLGAAFLLVTQDLPSAKELRNYEPPITSRVHAGDGRLVAEFANQHRVYVPSAELPDQLIQAFISAEDKSFFEHSGIDYWGVLRGTVGNAIRGRRMTGGSTITQQTVKNMLVGNERSIIRKMREAVLAGRLEQQFTKHQILELYMNEIYLGGRSYGVGAAALNYFGKSLSELTLAECAMLAALPQAPSRVNPYNRPDAAVERRNWVIDRMVANGYIDKVAAEQAKAEPLKTVSRLDTAEAEAAAYYVEELRREILRLGEADKLEGFGNEKEATKAFYEGGLSIRSTLDTNLQLAAQTVLRAGLETFDRRHGWRGPIDTIKPEKGGEAIAGQLKEFAESEAGKKKIAGAGDDWQLAVVTSTSGGVKLGLADGSSGSLSADDVRWASRFERKGKSGLQSGDIILVSKRPTPDVSVQTIEDYASTKRPAGNAPWRLRQIPVVEGALVAMDPHTGRVMAMAGGYSFRKSQYNRAVQAMRQPGSAFKPFVYLAAMENGWTPASRVLDAPYVSCDPHQDKCYKPSNYTNQFYGLQTLRWGIEKSRNAMTVRLAQDMGFEKMSEIGERTGIYDDLPPYEAMSLGAGETTPIRMATAYAQLVNGGKRVRPVLFDRIQNRYGETIYKSDERACDGCATEWKAGLKPPTLADPREQVIDPVTAYQMVSILEGVVTRGTATSVRTVGKPLAAKTGTTNDYVDAWTVGFSPDLVTAVWIGYDQPKSMGEGESGGRAAAPMFRDFMTAALKDRPPLPFRIPQGVRLVEVDADSGCLPGPDTRLIILEAFKPGTEPLDRCAPATGEDGYRIDASLVMAGDESVSATDQAAIDSSVFAPPAGPPALPGAPAAPGGASPPGQTAPRVDPATGQPAQPQQPQPDEELTIRDGIF
jgi:penicillin-binding protein 1A